VRTIGVPRYLKEEGKEARMTRIARFRLGSEMREGRFWEGEKRKCRLCGWEEETWEHVVEVCMGEKGGSGKEMIVKILDEGGGGEGWMKRLQGRREEQGRVRGEEEGGRTKDGRRTRMREREEV